MVAPTGFFGSATLKAVKNFQRANGISPTGYVATYTRAKIKEIDCNGGSIQLPVSANPVNSSFGQPCIKDCNPGFQDQGKVGTPTPTMPAIPATMMAPIPIPNTMMAPIPATSSAVNVSSYSMPKYVMPTVVTPASNLQMACTSTTAPFIKVLDPNGNFNFDISENNTGLNMKISWLMCNIPKNQVKVELRQGTSSYVFN